MSVLYPPVMKLLAYFAALCFLLLLTPFPASAETWISKEHECSLEFPDGMWTFEDGGTVRRRQEGETHRVRVPLNALNREQKQAVVLARFRECVTSIQNPKVARGIKIGFIESQSGNRVLGEGYTNVNGCITYWLSGFGSDEGEKVSLLHYVVCGSGTMYAITAKSWGGLPPPQNDEELLAILNSFKILAKLPPPAKPRTRSGLLTNVEVGRLSGILAATLLLGGLLIASKKQKAKNTRPRALSVACVMGWISSALHLVRLPTSVPVMIVLGGWPLAVWDIVLYVMQFVSMTGLWLLRRWGLHLYVWLWTLSLISYFFWLYADLSTPQRAAEEFCTPTMMLLVAVVSFRRVRHVPESHSDEERKPLHRGQQDAGGGPSPLTASYQINGVRFEVTGGDIQQIFAVRELLERSAKDLDLAKESDKTEFVKRYHQERNEHKDSENLVIVCPAISGL